MHFTQLDAAIRCMLLAFDRCRYLTRGKAECSCEYRLNLKCCGNRTTLPPDATRGGRVQIYPSLLHATDPTQNFDSKDLRIRIQFAVSRCQAG